MYKNALKVLGVFLGILFVYGCASKDVEVRHYIDVKDRVDQTIAGNAGYLSGTPQPEDRTNLKKTRKIYVLEVSKGENIDDTVAVAEEEDHYANSSVPEDTYSDDENIVEVSRGVDTSFDDDYAEPQDDIDTEESVAPQGSFVEYTVQKDDTLQKISKKFYDSYSKWPRIYEMNKDVIGNPDSIKPGIVLQIPVD